MNNNKLDENALLAGCKGVFSKTSYITFGNKEWVSGRIACVSPPRPLEAPTDALTLHAHRRKPEEYVKKGGVRSCYAGKHFTTAPPKDGKTNDVYFEKKHNWVHDVGGAAARFAYMPFFCLLCHLIFVAPPSPAQGDKYVDRIRYKDIQTEKKKVGSMQACMGWVLHRGF